MGKGIEYDGFVSINELENAPGVPSLQDLNKKPLAVIECVEHIPCNPCEDACPFGAINIGDCINNLPTLDPEKCRGCGTCIAHCPGLAIFVVDMNFTPDSALVKIPYEFYPVPKKGMNVDCLDRKGKIITKGKIHSVKKYINYNKTYVIGIEVSKELVMSVRSMRM